MASADEQSSGDAQSEAPDPDPGAQSTSGGSPTEGPQPCLACRGSGQVISNLGGTATQVACPWCDGTGVRPTEPADAQARWREESADQPPPAA